MKYLLLSDIRNNGKILKSGLIDELKGFNNINQLLEVKAIVPYTKEEIVKKALAEVEDTEVKVEDIIEESKEMAETKKAEQELADDTGVDVKDETKKAVDTSKSRGRGRSKK